MYVCMYKTEIHTIQKTHCIPIININYLILCFFVRIIQSIKTQCMNKMQR